MEDVAGIYAREAPFLDRYVQLGIASGRVVHVSFPEESDEDADTDHELLDRVEAYLDGVTEDDFDDVEVGLTVPTDQRSVLEAVQSLPYGESVTVEQVATMTPSLDPEEAADLTLVREALSNNPVPLFIPDHRVGNGPSGAPPVVEQRLRSLEEMRA
jgi:methylated-DNA-[protein]-cysteine S-methyltransferase